MSMPAPASRTNDAAICVTANTRSRRLVPGRDPHAAARQTQSARRFRRRQARHEREQDGGGHRQDDADPEQARIDGDVVRAHGEAGGIARQHGHHRPRDDDGEHRARAAQQQAFGQERSAQRAGARAKRRANGQLAFAADRARENQVRDVRAGDDEDQRRRGEQHQQDGSRRRDDLVAQVHRVDAEVRLRLIRLRMLLHDGAVHGTKLRARRLESRTRAPAGRRAPSSGAPALRPSSRRDGAGS